MSYGTVYAIYLEPREVPPEDPYKATWSASSFITRLQPEQRHWRQKLTVEKPIKWHQNLVSHTQGAREVRRAPEQPCDAAGLLREGRGLVAVAVLRAAAVVDGFPGRG